MNTEKLKFEEVVNAIDKMFIKKLGKVYFSTAKKNTDEHYAVVVKHGDVSVEWEVKVVDEGVVFIQIETLQDLDGQDYKNKAVTIEGILKELGIGVKSNVINGYLTYTGSVMKRFKSKTAINMERMGKFKDLLDI